MEKWPGMAPNGAGRICVPTNPDLADILGRMDLDFENFHVFVFFGSQISGFPSPQNLQISRFPDFQTPPAPADAGAACGDVRLPGL